MLKEDWYAYGEFKDGLLNGQGIKILTDGSTFEGIIDQISRVILSTGI